MRAGDVTAVLRELRIPYLEFPQHHHCTPDFAQIDCPYCSPNSRRWRMGVAYAGTHCVCWTCGRQRLGDALALLSGLSVGACLDLLRGVRPARREDVGATAPGRLVLPAGLGPLLPIHRAYLRKRGFDPDELARVWGVMGIGAAAKLAWRVWIPIRLGDKILSWTTRAPSDDAVRRYKNAPRDCEAISAKSLLYGEELAGHAIVVHEGPADVWRTGPGAVATMGVNVSEQQLLRISRHPKRAVCFDDEPQAQRRAERLCRALEGLPGRTFLVRLGAKDAAQAPDDEIEQLRGFIRG